MRSVLYLWIPNIAVKTAGSGRTKPMVEHIRYFRVALKGVDAMSATTSRAYPRHTHDQYGIGVIDSGGHASLSGRGQVEAGTGNLIFVNPGEVHDGRALGGRPRSWRILYFEPAAMVAVRGDVLEGATDVPSFAFFCNFPDDVKQPYKNYLENKLRENFNFSGVPIEIVMKKKA